MLLSDIPYIFFDETEANVGSTKNIVINIQNPEDTLSCIKNKILSGIGFAVATINLDHVVKLASDEPFYQAYKKHDIIVPDGFPIVWLGKLTGQQKIERTPGSDLIFPVMKLLEQEKKSLALFGTTEEVLEDVKSKLQKLYPKLSIVYSCSPVFGFDPTGTQAEKYIDDIEKSGASVCFIALGAPKQEIFASCARRENGHVGYISIGASLDFIAGKQKRAPLWAQRCNLEWFWRMTHDPKRLFLRYTKCALIFPILLMHIFMTQPKGS